MSWSEKTFSSISMGDLSLSDGFGLLCPEKRLGCGVGLEYALLAFRGVFKMK